MNIKHTIGLFVAAAALMTIDSQAQTNPTGTVTSTTRPQGAVAPDSMPVKMSRQQKRMMKKSRKQDKATTGTVSTTTEEARYRASSASDGTAINNSNTTNYNSNNVTNAPTGVGSNPNTPSVLKAEDKNAPKENMGKTTSDAGAVEAVKGAEMSKEPAVKAGSTVRNTSIGDFMASSPNYTTLQNALQSSDLFDMLKGSGPYTLFAPNNEAFKKLPAAVQGGLLDGSNRDALRKLLSYHVVSGSLDKETLASQLKASNGKAQLKTVAGGMLTVQAGANGGLTILDEQGNKVQVESTPHGQSNGVVYGIANVLMPQGGAAAFR